MAPSGVRFSQLIYYSLSVPHQMILGPPSQDKSAFNLKQLDSALSASNVHLRILF